MSFLQNARARDSQCAPPSYIFPANFLSASKCSAVDCVTPPPPQLYSYHFMETLYFKLHAKMSHLHKYPSEIQLPGSFLGLYIVSVGSLQCGLATHPWNSGEKSEWALFRMLEAWGSEVKVITIEG